MANLATTVYTATVTDIPGLLVIDIDYPKDERGYYQENYQKEKLVAAGLPADFNVVQTNVSYNTAKGVTRGMHAEPWNKYLSVVTGEIFVAYVDLREGPSFGKVFTTTLNKNKAIFLPEGVANSFQTLTPETYYLYSVDAHWSADAYDQYCFVNLNDPSLNIDWPIPLSEAVLSERDQAHPMLKDAKKFKGRS